MKSNVVELLREYKQDSTVGRLVLPNGVSFYTIELPWRGNQQRVSCIPEGMYKLQKRVSGVVQRSTGNEFIEGWEVKDVDNRTYIMIHPGNTVKDFLGCIGVGKSRGVIGGLEAVLSSRQAFRELMSELGDGEWFISIREDK